MSMPACQNCSGVDCDTCNGLGFVPNPTGFHPDTLVLASHLFPGQTVLSVLGAAPEVFPDVIVNSDLIPLAGGIRNQMQSSGCVGFTFAEVLSLIFAGLGLTRIFSAFFFYWLGRAEGRQAGGLPTTTKLTDGGTSPALVVQGLGVAGAALEAAMPSVDMSKVNDDERSGAASDAAPRIPLVVTAFVAIEADNDTDTENAVLQGLLPRSDGKRGRAVLIAVCADPLQVADGSKVVEPSLTGRIDHMLEAVDAVKVVSFDPATMTGTLTNGLTLEWVVAPVVGQYVYRLQNHWAEEGSPKCDIPGTAWVSRAFILAAQFKFLIDVDTAAILEAA